MRQLGFESLDEFAERHLAEIATTTGTHGNGVCRHLFITNHQLVRQLLQTMFANFIGNFLVSQVRKGAEAGFIEPPGHLAGIIGLMLGDIEDDDLLRREP